MNGVFIKGAKVPNSCGVCGYGMGGQVECPYYVRDIENDQYKDTRHPNCIITGNKDGVFIRNATMPKSCHECEYGGGEQVKCEIFWKIHTKGKRYKKCRHPDCNLKEIDYNLLKECAPVENV